LIVICAPEYFILNTPFLLSINLPIKKAPVGSTVRGFYLFYNTTPHGGTETTTTTVTTTENSVRDKIIRFIVFEIKFESFCFILSSKKEKAPADFIIRRSLLTIQSLGSYGISRTTPRTTTVKHCEFIIF
jgi:hypothetical protein